MGAEVLAYDAVVVSETHLVTDLILRLNGRMTVSLVLRLIALRRSEANGRHLVEFWSDVGLHIGVTVDR